MHLYRCRLDAINTDADHRQDCPTHQAANLESFSFSGCVNVSPFVFRSCNASHCLSFFCTFQFHIKTFDAVGRQAAGLQSSFAEAPYNDIHTMSCRLESEVGILGSRATPVELAAASQQLTAGYRQLPGRPAAPAPQQLPQRVTQRCLPSLEAARHRCPSHPACNDSIFGVIDSHRINKNSNISTRLGSFGQVQVYAISKQAIRHIFSAWCTPKAREFFGCWTGQGKYEKCLKHLGDENIAHRIRASLYNGPVVPQNLERHTEEWRQFTSQLPSRC